MRSRCGGHTAGRLGELNYLDRWGVLFDVFYGVVLAVVVDQVDLKVLVFCSGYA